ncbi:MAG: septum formation initiator family protein [Proteobacteria bacterium]|nr:septum formation initiator family protein [Pseudomonadota bacterium]MBU1389123.1 septum formation initiator family protein [Pseudomonadota bacterium]MBU1543347.1 septum formation initiator family protein [Pseudomonadota bacterium]MBU2480908.1 septum formation initiator family protein [Pseudomonadota bacterium]
MSVMEKAGYSISFIIILILMCFIIFSTNGLLDYRKLKHKEAGVIEQIKAADSVTQKLETQIISLKNDMEYIKHVAKHEHDMAEKDELIFKDKPSQKREGP